MANLIFNLQEVKMQLIMSEQFRIFYFIKTFHVFKLEQ